MSIAILPFSIGHEFLPDGKAKLTVKCGDGCTFVDTFNLLRAPAREQFVRRVLGKFPRLETEMVFEKVDALAGAYAAWADKQPAGKPPERAGYTPPDRAELLAGMEPGVRDEAAQLLRAPDLMQKILADIEKMGVVGERKLAATIYLLGVSRLLDHPLAAIVQGPSSSGKSYVIDKISRLFPAETVIRATSLTPQSLYYLPDGTLSHKWVIAGERSRREEDDQAEATRALREMLSSGEISKMLAEKSRDGQMETHKIHQSGPIAFTETTTMSRIFEEDLNRCILLHTTETQEQNRAILLAAGKDTEADVRPIIRRHWAMQRSLEPLDVHIPFATELAEKFPAERTESRRAFPQLLTAIKASALLHQHQRARDTRGAIVAEPADYTLARSLLETPLAEQLGGALSAAARRFWVRLLPRVADKDTFTTADASRGDPASVQAIRGWLRELTEAAMTEAVEPARGPRPAVWRLIPGAGEKEPEAILPMLGKK